MTKYGNTLVPIFLVLWFGSPLAADVPNSQTWPLNLSSRYLTSNFMEHRNGRFHAGLDLKTQSREGFAVRAVEDGYISRIRCTPTAYGRVVYLRGVSGKTYVFAHLSRFNDDLRRRVEQVQKQNQTYRARLEFRSGQVPIKKGQILGLSGQSGTGGPHLHFEVRDPNQCPVNPLGHGFAVPDTFPPVIHTLRAWPVSAESRINGETGEWVLSTSKSEGLQGAMGTLQVSGPVAFSARMIDAADIRGHKLEPWLIELELDGEIVYRCQNDQYAFSENALQRLEWTDWADWTDEGVPREHWLHRRTANTLVGREGALWYLGPEGQGLEPGNHDLILKVRDHAGGATSVQWVLQVVESKLNPDSLVWKRQTLGINSQDSISPRLTPFFSTGNPGKSGFTVLHFSKEKGDPVLEDIELWVKPAEPQSSFFDMARAQGLEPMGQAHHFLTADWPIESSMQVSFPGAKFPENQSSAKLMIYRLNRKNEWKTVCPVSFSGSNEFHLEEPGLHSVFRDSIPPQFQSEAKTLETRLGAKQSIPGVTLPKWEITPINLVDLGSGVETGTIKAQLDGQGIIIEPDNPRDRLLVEWPNSMTPGNHTLEIEAADQAGNKAHAVFQVLATDNSP